MDSEDPPVPSARQARKARKVTRACDACKSKKKACTGTIPCGPCMRRNIPCAYQTAYNRGVAVSPPPSTSPRKRPTPQGIGESWNAQALSPVTARSNGNLSARETSASSLTSLETETGRTLQTAADPAREANVAGQYWGPTSAHSFLGRVVQDIHSPAQSRVQPTNSDPSSNVSIFSFGDRQVPEVRLADFQWPDKATAEKLVRRYFEFAAPTYRVLHQPTVDGLVQRLYQTEARLPATENPLDAACQATLLLVFSTATMFQKDAEGYMRDADEGTWRTSELYFSRAENLLLHETGAPSLASVQARFIMVLYMLSSSRAHKAWFTFGTTVQLMMALGLHSRRPKLGVDEEDLVQKECQRRVVWCSYTLDKYLSVMLGRPRLWQDEDIDQDLPARINDQDLTSQERRPSMQDCLMDAPVCHTLLAMILTQTAKEPYIVTGISNKEQINSIRDLCGRVAEWQTELPPFLSGVIQPGSLIPVFRRQLTVLQLARYHALMFITRPLLLRNYGQMWPECEASYQHYLSICLTTARDAIELILAFVRENQLFPAFWYSQYIAFNALSIIYLYLIQTKRGYLSASSLRSIPDMKGTTLYQLAEVTQDHLEKATVRNAPSWKYSAILQGLRQELARLGQLSSDSDDQRFEVEGAGARVGRQIPGQSDNYRIYSQSGPGPRTEHNLTASNNQVPDLFATPYRSIESFPLDPRTESLFDNFAVGEDLILDFWPLLDGLPSTYTG